MFRLLLATVVASLFWCETCAADIVVSIGNVVLQPNQAEQTVPILVSCDSGTQVEGVNLCVSLGDGLNGLDQEDSYAGPTIANVDLIGDGTIFCSNNNGSPTIPWTYTYSWTVGIMTASRTSGLVVPSGVLAKITFDTTGIDPKAYVKTWTLGWSSPFGEDTTFSGSVPAGTLVTLEPGTVRIMTPEPGTGILLIGLACGAAVFHLLRRRRRRQTA